MTYTMRSYGGADDLEKMQMFTAQNTAQVGDCGQLHVGDIPHRIYNGFRKLNPADVVKLWEDEQGNLVAFVMLSPNKWSSFELYIKPELWQSEVASNLLRQTEIMLVDLMASQPDPGDTVDIHPEANPCDTARIQLYQAHGYEFLEHAMTVTQRSLFDPIPDAPLANGFSIRSATGDHEAAQLAAVHHGAFKSNWTEAEYRKLMNTPGYSAENEMVVVAPNGEFAAFTVIWPDWINKSMLFEPVGTHENYQRRGLGRALMAAAMRRMYAHGIETAYVVHEAENTASTGLYHALGFQTKHEIHVYKKTVPAKK